MKWHINPGNNFGGDKSWTPYLLGFLGLGLSGFGVKPCLLHDEANCGLGFVVESLAVIINLLTVHIVFSYFHQVHRLDRESSGLLLMGRTKESIAHLQLLFSYINKAQSKCQVSYVHTA
jgi:hypothetical protein